MKQFPLVAVFLALAFISLDASAQPYGLTAPQPVGPYLNNVFPTTAPTVSASWNTEMSFTTRPIDQPMFLTPYPKTNKLVVVRKPGQVVVFDNRRNVNNSE